MAKSIFITATHRGSGKTTLCLGVINALERELGRVAYFKPIGESRGSDQPTDVSLIRDALDLRYELDEMEPFTSEEVAEALSGGRYDEILDDIFEAYQNLARRADFVVIEGTDYAGAMASFEFNINADLSKNLDAPTVLVTSAADCEAGCASMLNNVGMVAENLQEKGCELFGVIINRAAAADLPEIERIASQALGKRNIPVLGTIPQAPMLERPTVAEIAQALHARVVSGEGRLDVVARDVSAAAMGLENVLKRVTRGALVLVPGDRDDLIVGLAAAYESTAVESPCGMVLTGGVEPHEVVRDLMVDLTSSRMPVLQVDTNTYETAVAVSKVSARLDASQRARIEVVKGLVERHMDFEPIYNRAVFGVRSERVTPKQFMHRIVDLARSQPMRIVLPEGTEERILRASEALVARGIAELTLLGVEDKIREKIRHLSLKLDDVRIIEPAKSEWREAFAKRYQELRRPKRNPVWDLAMDLMADPTYFGTMMVQEGKADGLVSGSVTTTAATLRPALEFVKTKEGYSIASSVFFMCLPDSVLVYGDCAVNPNPTASQLADIALASAVTAQAFDVTPKVAMLSYSTGTSGTGSDVDKVREATEIVRKRAPDLPVEGPIQYDAAIDPGVAATKLPGSAVAGNATVFIFPDLNSGNNTYKAVQRAANAIAIGPVMQGLRKPVNDLSRGCTVTDIINTVAITAVQAQRG